MNQWGEVVFAIANRITTIVVGADVALSMSTAMAAPENTLKTKLGPVIDRWVEDVANKGIDDKALVDKARTTVAKCSKQSSNCVVLQTIS